MLDETKLAGRGLTAADVVETLKKNNEVLSAGLVEDNHELYLALVDGRVHELAGLERMAIPVAKGPPATLSELGTLRVADENLLRPNHREWTASSSPEHSAATLRGHRRYRPRD